jgi:hypothetical protein
VTEGLGALWGFLAAWLAPGAALVAWLGLGRDRLERLVLSIALGRLLLAAVALAAVSSVGPWALHGWALVGIAAWAVARRRAPRPAGAGLPRVPLLAVAAAAVLLVGCVVGLGGLPDADGNLVFRGRDSTNDPLVYAALARQLHETGLPLSYPFAGGAATTSSYVPYGTMVALHTFGVPMIDVTLRVLPGLDALALGATAVAVVRALGGGTPAALLGGVLVLLGGDPSFWLRPLGALLGRPVQVLDTWAFFGPYLLAFNPGTAALQGTFAAFLLLHGLRPGARRAAVVLGALVAGLFEVKLFVWAPAFAGLCALAWLWPVRAVARELRLSSAVAALAVLPFLVEKLWWAARLAGSETTGLVLCPACLPRYLIDASLGSRDLSFRIFEGFAPAQLASPTTLVATGVAGAITLAIAVGARGVALPGLWRAARDPSPAAPGSVALARWVLLGAGLALGAALLFTTAPHYLNGAQFAWLASVGLWPFAAPVLVRWWQERRLAALALVAALVVPGTVHALWSLGLRAPEQGRVAAHELALLDELRARSAADEVVLEPSLLASTDFPSPVAWHAGRSVYLSLLSAARILPESEVLARHDRLVTVFAGDDPSAALDAVRESGARWVLAPRDWPLRFDARPALEPVVRGAGGTLYRVTERAEPEGGLGKDPADR